MEHKTIVTKNKPLKHVFVRELKKDLLEVNVKFIECIRYQLSINMYCAAGIADSEGKKINNWLNNSNI